MMNNMTDSLTEWWEREQKHERVTNVVGPQCQSDLHLRLINKVYVSLLEISALFWREWTNVFNTLHYAYHICQPNTSVTANTITITAVAAAAAAAALNYIHIS